MPDTPEPSRPDRDAINCLTAWLTDESASKGSEPIEVYFGPGAFVFGEDDQRHDCTAAYCALLRSPEFLTSARASCLISGLESEWRALDPSVRTSILDGFVEDHTRLTSEQARFGLSCIIGEQEDIAVGYRY